MTTVPTSQLQGAALDWAVAKCGELLPKIEASVSYPNNKHYRIYTKIRYDTYGNARPVSYSPSTEWAQGGPIIERELIDIQAKFNSGSSIVPKGQWYWQASTVNEDDVAYWLDGTTPLIAAMRCYVASKLGDEVDIPEELA